MDVDEGQLSFDDLLDLPVVSKEPTPEEVADKTVTHLLAAWASKSNRSQKGIRTTHESFCQRLLSGTDKEDLKYVITHRTLLASKKVISLQQLDEALAKLPEDKEAGRNARQIFELWYDQWYKDRYTQTPGQIVVAVKNALLLGVTVPVLSEAMNILGRRQQVITGPSLQYAIAQAAKNQDKRMNTGSHAGLIDKQTRQDIFKNNRETIGNFDTEEAPF